MKKINIIIIFAAIFLLPLSIFGQTTPELKKVLNAGNDGGAKQIKNLANPSSAQDAATKFYVDALQTYVNNTFLAIPSTYTTVIAATDTFYIRKTSNGTYYKVPFSSISSFISIAGISPIVVNTNTISITDAAADGTTKGAASFNPNDFNSSSGNISIDYTNGQAASGSTKGFLTSTDWSNFDGKQDALVSGTNIKTVNSTSLLGSGNVAVEPVISAGTTSDYWRGDKTWQSFNTAARSAVSLTTTGTSGAATYNSGTGVLNVPNYSGGASQWTTTGNDIYNSNTGNVGIGNSSPDAKLDVVSTSTVNPVASFSVNTSGSTNATGVNINAEGGTTTDALVVNSKSNVSGGINNAIVALATTANSGYNNPFTSIAQNGDYNYGAKVIAQGGVDAVGLSISASGASGNNNAIDITAGNLKYTPGTEGSGKVLTSDANGVASWQTPAAGGVTTAVAPLSITTNTISIQTPTSGTVLRANGTSWTNSTYSVSNTFTANSILHATGTNTVGENTSFGFNGNQMYMGTTTPSTDHGIDFRWNNNAATYWRFYNPSTGTSSRNIMRLYNQSYVLDFGINGINFTNSGLLRASTPFILFNAPTNENGLIYTSSTNGLIFAIGGSSSSNAKMYLDGTNGFVGIGTGTVAATAPLHVTGSTRALQISSTATTVATRPLMVINSAGDTILQLNSRGMFQTGNLEENLYFGTFQGQKTTTGTYNTGIGKYCFSFLTTGSYNTANGHGSQYKMTTGSRNSSYAVNSLYNDTSGSYNGAFGVESQNQNLSGSQDNSFGYASSFSNKTGSYNNAFGNGALFENLGSGNLALGHYAGYYGTWNNKGFIDNQDRTDSATQLRKSFMVMDFGADSSVQQLRLNGRIKITGGNYGNGKVLTSDANGLASWNTLASIGGVTGTGTNNYVNFWTGTSTQSGDASFQWDNTNKAILLNSASYGTERIGITAGSKYGVNVGLTAASGWAAFRAFVNSSSTTLTDNIGMILTNANTTAGSGIAFQMNVGGSTGMFGYATYVDANNSKYSMYTKSSNLTTQVVTMDGSTKMSSFGYGITTPLSALYVGNSLTLTPTSRKGALLRVGDFIITDNSSAGSAAEIVGSSMGAISFAGINNRTYSYGTGTFFPKPIAGTNVTINTGGLFGFGTDGSGYIEESLSINKDASSNIPTERLDVGGNIVLSGQAYNPIYTIAHTATVTPNWDNSGMQKVTLASATTVANSTNLKSGAVYTVYLYQDAMGGRVITWGSQYKFPTAVAPTLTSTPSALDIITFVSDGTNLYMAGIVYDLQ